MNRLRSTTYALVTAALTTGTLLAGTAAHAARPTSGGKPCTIVGTMRNDRLVGTSRADVICGLGGNDVIEGRAGNDVLDGGAGDDTLTGESGADRMTGGPGSDTASYRERRTSVVANLDGKPGDGAPGEADTVGGDVEGLLGGSAGDTLTGNGTANVIDGGPGDDTLAGEPGNDVLRGGAGNDRLAGGPGRDSASYTDHRTPVVANLDGKPNDGSAGETDTVGDDLEGLTGGTGDDMLTGDDAANVIDGGPGDDTLLGGPGGDQLTGRDGDDQLDGGTGGDTVDGGPDADVCTREGAEKPAGCAVEPEITLPAAVTFAGTVTDATGGPVAGLSLLGYSAGSGIVRATTDTDGEFHIGLRPGNLELHVLTVWGITAAAKLPSFFDLYGTTWVKSDVDAAIALPAATPVRVHVTDDDGEPLPGAKVTSGFANAPAGDATLWPGGPAYATQTLPMNMDGVATADENGDAELYAFPGTVLTWLAARHSFGGVIETTSMPEVEVGDATEVSLSIDRPHVVTLSGRVVTADGQAAPDLVVQGYRDGQVNRPDHMTMVRTDADGGFRLPVLADRPVALYVSGDRLPGHPGYFTLSATTTLAADTDVTITLPGPQRVTVHVTDGDGAPLAGASVTTGFANAQPGEATLWPDGPVYALQTLPLPFDTTATTDEAGDAEYFVFPGTTVQWVRARHGAATDVRLGVPATDDLDFVLQN